MMKRKVIFSLVCGLSYSLCEAGPVMPGHIVGRDMDTRIIKRLGHVGIATAPSINQPAYQVLEVLHDHPVIQLNSLADFKSRSRYWGSRYGLGNKSQHLAALRFGNFQQDLDCAEYTYKAQFKPNEGTYTRAGYAVCKKSGLFRCDTFIYFLFKFISGVDIPVGNAITPKRLFMAFPHGNGDGPYAYQPSPGYERMPQTRQPKVTLDKATPELLINMDEEEFLLTIDTPDEALAKEKAPWLLSMLKSPDLLNFEKKMYIADTLRMTGDASMIPELIERYRETQGLVSEGVVKYQNMLISAVHILYGDDPKDELKPVVKRFYLDLLQSPILDVGAVSNVIRGLISIMPEEQLLQHRDQMKRLVDTTLKNKKTSRLAMEAEMLFAMPSMQEKQLESIIAFLKMEQSDDLYQQFNHYLVKSMAHSDMQIFQTSSKEKLKSYLDCLAEKYEIPPARLSMDDAGLSYGAWLEATALMNAHTFIGASKYIDQFLSKIKSVDGQSQYVIGFSSSAYLQEAFDREPVLVRYKAKQKDLYESSVGDTRFGAMGY